MIFPTTLQEPGAAAQITAHAGTQREACSPLRAHNRTSLCARKGLTCWPGATSWSLLDQRGGARCIARLRRITEPARALGGVSSGQHGIGIATPELARDAGLQSLADYTAGANLKARLNQGKLLRNKELTNIDNSGPALDLTAQSVLAADLTCTHSAGSRPTGCESTNMQHPGRSAAAYLAQDLMRCSPSCKPDAARPDSSRQMLFRKKQALAKSKAAWRKTALLAKSGAENICSPCPSCPQGLLWWSIELKNGLLDAERTVVKTAHHAGGKPRRLAGVEAARHGGIGQVLT